MVLVHEKMLEYEPMVQHFQSKQDLTWKRLTEESVKSSFSKQIKSTVEDPAIPEDVEAKRYRQHLNRFLHTKRKLDDEPLAPTIDEPEYRRNIKPKETKKKTKRKKKRKTVVEPKAKRTSKRISRKPQQYADIDWQTWLTMESVYYETGKPGSFGGIRALVRYGVRPVKKVKGWLEAQDIYRLHKPIVKNFPRRKTFAKGINYLFQADLADMQNLASYNDGHSYILTCIDLFSRFKFVVPITEKRWRSRSRRFQRNAFRTCCRRIAGLIF
jgi:hypothetical protein